MPPVVASSADDAFEPVLRLRLRRRRHRGGGVDDGEDEEEDDDRAMVVPMLSQAQRRVGVSSGTPNSTAPIVRTARSVSAPDASAVRGRTSLTVLSKVTSGG